jgi:zinc transport system substrate-binding protein
MVDGMLTRLAATITGLLTFAAAGCASGTIGGDPGSVQVVAAFYPLQFVAERVGGGTVAVTGLTPPGAEAHDLELSPSQVADVAGADLVIYLPGFQPAVDDVIAAHGSGAAFDAAAVVPPLGATTGGHADEDEHGATDPHVWLDPDRLATIATDLATALGELDPEHAAGYTANAAALGEDLATLDAELAAGLADCQRREIVVSHAAFGYLADRYELRQIAITGLSPEDEPTPQRLAEVIQQAEQYHATTIFFEVLVSPAVADVIADEVGAGTAVLDPIEGLAPGSDQDYLSLMRANLAALRTALDCR